MTDRPEGLQTWNQVCHAADQARRSAQPDVDTIGVVPTSYPGFSESGNIEWVGSAFQSGPAQVARPSAVTGRSRPNPSLEALPQDRLLGGIRGEGEGALVGEPSLVRVAERAQHFGPGGVIQVVPVQLAG